MVIWGGGDGRHSKIVLLRIKISVHGAPTYICTWYINVAAAVGVHQRCQISNKKSKFGQIVEGLAMEVVGIFRAILSILRPYGVRYGHLVQFVVIWYIFPQFGISYLDKSGNPGVHT
jgi:hypothetical protein